MPHGDATTQRSINLLIFVAITTECSEMHLLHSHQLAQVEQKYVLPNRWRVSRHTDHSS